MVSYTWVLGGAAPDGLERRELTQAYGRTITMRIDAASSAQFSLDGRSDEAKEIATLATDLHVYRNGVKIFRGRITAEADTINESAHSTQFSAIDYRGMLDYRIVGPTGATYRNLDQATIAYALVNVSQTLPGGNWGITNGAGAVSGVMRDRTYDPGKPIGEALTELGRVDGGFEWEIDSSLSLNRWYPRRGASNGVVLDYGGMIVNVGRTFNPQDFANSVLVTGTNTLTPVAATTTGIATDPRGRWEHSFGYPGIQEQATLTDRATWTLAATSTVRPEVSVTLTPGAWAGPAALGLGDTVALSVISGRLALSGAYRIGEIQITPADGSETIILGLVPA